MQTTANSTRQRLLPDERRQKILDAAIVVAMRKGYRTMSQRDVAVEAEVSKGLLAYYFQTMDKLRVAVMEFSIEHELFSIIAQGLTLKDPQAMEISPDLKEKVLAYI